MPSTGLGLCRLPDGTPAILLRRAGEPPEVLPLFGGSLVNTASKEQDRLHVLHQNLHGDSEPVLSAQRSPGQVMLKNLRYGTAFVSKQVVQLLLQWAGLAILRHGADPLKLRLLKRGRPSTAAQPLRRSRLGRAGRG